jgi:hypothetical protein
MQANREGTFNGSRYAGKTMFARRTFVREELVIEVMNIRNQNGFTVE